MEFSVSSLAILVSIINIINLLTSFILYKMNSDRKGILPWVLANAAYAAGFILNYLRIFPEFRLIAILLNNIFFIFGMVFFLISIKKLLNQKINYRFISTYLIVVIALIAYFTFFNDNFIFRRIIITLAISILSFINAYFLGTHKPKFTRLTTQLTSIIFFFNAISLISSNIPFFFELNFSNITNSEFLQLLTYLNSIIFSTLITIGIVLLVNQQVLFESQQNRKNAETLFNTSPDSILITRLSDGCFIAVNEGFINMTGYTREEVLEKTTLDLDIWVNPQNRTELVKQLQIDGIIENAEYEFRTKNRVALTGLVSARIIEYKDEPHIISVIHDISNRKIADQKFRMLFELSPIGLSMVDNETGMILEVNESFMEMTGYTKEEFLKLSYWDITPDNYLELEKKQMKDVMETGYFGPNEKEYIRKDGSLFQASISGVLVKGPEGKSINWGFIEDITERKKLQDELKKQATTDELTGLYNRRQFISLAQKELIRSVRNFHPVCVALFDLDRLKFFNDTFGHHIGDLALTTFSEQCKNNIRDIDIIARYGGDEFVVLLPETNIEQAEIALERIRNKINNTTIQIGDQELQLSTSIGLATMEHQNDTLDEVLTRADAALYAAKNQGKNRVESNTDSESHWPPAL